MQLLFYFPLVIFILTIVLPQSLMVTTMRGSKLFYSDNLGTAKDAARKISIGVQTLVVKFD